MRYTFEYNGKQKTIEIDDAWLKNQKVNLKLSTKEAIELWLFDHDYAESAEANALTQKAMGAGAGVKGERKPRKAPERKPDEAKRAIIAGLAEYIGQYPEVRDPRVLNIERIISFSLGDDTYELTLSKKRKPKG